MNMMTDPPPEWEPGTVSVAKFDLFMSDLPVVQFIRMAVLTAGGPILPKVSVLEIASGWVVTYKENLETDAIDVTWEKA